MTIRHKIATGALLATAALFAASFGIGQQPYITPGTHQVFHMDSNVGALLEFLVLAILGITAIVALLGSRRSAWVFACIAGAYMAGVMLTSLLSPRKIVSIGDGYCWDIWCVQIQSVNAAPRMQDILYTADVSLFADSASVQRLQADRTGKQFFYVLDDEGRRFPILRSSSQEADIVVKPGESVKAALSFVAPANARHLYLAGDVAAPLWVRLYFGSDLNPFHKRTLLRLI